MLKPLKRRQNDPNYQAKMQKFCTEANSQLFDIAVCKCLDINHCNCEKSFKVPVAERSFLEDQRSTRNMMIGSIDKVVTNRLKESDKRRKKFPIFTKLQQQPLHLTPYCLQILLNTVRLLIL